MSLRIIILPVCVFFCISSLTAQTVRKKTSSVFDLSGSIGKSQGSGVISFIHFLGVGKKKNFEIGAGLRVISYFSESNYFISAPATITSGKTGPAVFFIENIKANIDSLLVPSSQLNAVNLSANFGYHISQKFYAGFNIDFIGFSFGAKKNVNYINGTTAVNSTAKPTAFNLLLISDNDIGTLNSEFFAGYKVNQKWLLKAGYQFLFTEYRTSTKVQQVPEPNDRFRNKVSAFLLGARYQLN